MLPQRGLHWVMPKQSLSEHISTNFGAESTHIWDLVWAILSPKLLRRASGRKLGPAERDVLGLEHSSCRPSSGKLGSGWPVMPGDEAILSISRGRIHSMLFRVRTLGG